MRKHAFTLIELLVVIAVISLLMGVLLPSLSRARIKSRTVVCASGMRQIGLGIYNYWTEWNGRVPWIETPMTNNYFGKPASDIPNEECDPFDRELWPNSLPNVLMPMYVGEEAGLFVCPAATNGWPREVEDEWRFTYRPAAANQPNGAITYEGTYIREFFGILDGRFLKRFEPEYKDDPLLDTIEYAKTRGTYLRDLIVRENSLVIGPHIGGANVLNRDLQVEYRDQDQLTKDLAPGYSDAGSQF